MKEVVWVTEVERLKLINEVCYVRRRFQTLWASCRMTGKDMDWRKFERVRDALYGVEEEVRCHEKLA